MSDFKSGAAYRGFSSTSDRTGLSYLYGLSDFWAIMFQDSEVIDRFLESNTIGLADIYSRFLQLTSSISVNDVQTFLYSEVKLLTVNTSDLVPSPSGTTYKIPENLVDARYLLDRPMLATKTLERNVHFNIDEVSSTITFYEPLQDLGFPSRALPNGQLQVAFWMTDVVEDDRLVSQYFGDLIDVSPQNVTRVYKDFIRGLYFLYTQGPTLKSLERGLSLALGIPLARTTEKVLLTVKNDVTGNWIVATDKSSYTIPYGITPSVSPGDELQVGEELVQVAEVLDYKVEDEWWLNISIPRELIPSAINETDLLATPGSTTDSIMREYLKYHTFLVRIRWDGSFNSTSFEEVFRILRDVKPKYTYPIFVWSIVDTDLIPIQDDQLGYDISYSLVDSLGCGGAYIQRFLERYGERENTCFIHGNLDPAEIDNPLSTVTVEYDVKSSWVLNTGAPSNIGVLDTELTPLYNTGELDLRQSLSSAGISLPAVLPKVMVIRDVPVNVTTYASVFIREAVEPGFIGIRFNETPLDFPVDTSHHMYQAYVPDITALSATEDLFVLEIQSNVYTIFIYRSGGVSLLSPSYFPRREEDPLLVVQYPTSVSSFTYELSSPDLVLSNSNLTVQG